MSFAEASRHFIEAALSASGGKIYLKPTTLQNKMKKLAIGRTS